MIILSVDTIFTSNYSQMKNIYLSEIGFTDIVNYVLIIEDKLVYSIKVLRLLTKVG